MGGTWIKFNNFLFLNNAFSYFIKDFILNLRNQYD
jgi:hypothetical protein